MEALGDERPKEATVQRVIMFSLREGMGSDWGAAGHKTHFSAPHTGAGLAMQKA